MRERESFNGTFAALLMALQILVTVTVTLSSLQVPTTAAQAKAIHQKTQPKRKTKPTAQAPINLNFSSFRHGDHHLTKAKLTCSNCHTIRPPQSPDVVAAAITTEIKNYPYHDKCLACHRVAKPQFFRGSTPFICAVCHTRPTPRLTKKDMNPFPKQSVQTILGDLSLMFNHESTSHRRECTTCHKNIAQVDIAKADAPISTCATSECHRKPGTQRNLDQEMLLLEDDDIAAGKNRNACTGCHSTAIAVKIPPCTHYKLFDGDGKYFNITDFPKSAKLIAKLVSEPCK